MSQLKFQVNLLSRFFSILPTNFKNMVSRKTRLKFGNTTELCIVDSHLICNTRTINTCHTLIRLNSWKLLKDIISHILKMQKMSKKIDFSKILHRWTPLKESTIVPSTLFEMLRNSEKFCYKINVKFDDIYGVFE